VLGFWVSGFQVSGNLETARNHWKHGNDFDKVLMYTQNKLHILQSGPGFFRYLVICKIVVLGRSEKVINSL